MYNRGMMEVRQEKILNVNGAKREKKPNLLLELMRDYPNLKWQAGERFLFRPERTIVYVELDWGQKEQRDLEKNLATSSSVLEALDKKNCSMSTEIVQVEQKVGTEGSRELMQENYWCMQLFHELGHALLGHFKFVTDVERLKMEREAWEKAAELYTFYAQKGKNREEKSLFSGFDQEFVEQELDSYRDWLHQRSRCPKCGLTRYQTRDQKYHCPACEQFL